MFKMLFNPSHDVTGRNVNSSLVLVPLFTRQLLDCLLLLLSRRPKLALACGCLGASLVVTKHAKVRQNLVNGVGGKLRLNTEFLMLIRKFLSYTILVPPGVVPNMVPPGVVE